jgi:hypothetical protein
MMSPLLESFEISTLRREVPILGLAGAASPSNVKSMKFSLVRRVGEEDENCCERLR